MININYSPQLNIHKKISFGNAFEVTTQCLNALNGSPAVGAIIVDIGSMALPRTIVDSKRGLDAGVETGVRETSGSVNHAMVGAYGLLGTLIAANLINSKYGISAKNIKADTKSVNLYSNIWQEFLNTSQDKTNNVTLRKNYFEYILNKTSGFNDHAKGNDYWIKVSADAKKDAMQIINKVLDNSSKNDYVIPKEERKKLIAILTADCGTASHIKVKFKEREIHTTVSSLVDDIYALSKVFTSDKVKKLYTEQNSEGINKFLKGFAKYKGVSTGIGLGLGCAIGASVQPLNRYFTRKRTGQTGFVGVNNKKSTDNPTTLNICKGLAVAAMAALVYTALGKNPSTLLSRVQFKGLMPTVDQFKLVYGVTIMSRFLAARDTNELRESTFKDFLGYANWLILGGFVSKLVANKINPNLVTLKDPAKDSKSFISWLKDSSLKSQDEILLTEAKNAKIDIMKGGKVKPFKELLKETVKKVPDVKVKLRGLNIAQLAGFAYSAIVLGWAIPKINIWFTNKINEEEKKEVATIEKIPAEKSKTPLINLLMKS